MSIRSLVVFGAGYVLGTRAGRERYQQIVEAAGKAAQRIGQPDLSKAVNESSVRLSDYLEECYVEWRSATVGASLKEPLSRPGSARGCSASSCS